MRVGAGAFGAVSHRPPARVMVRRTSILTVEPPLMRYAASGRVETAKGRDQSNGSCRRLR